jgi:hypothetical protein
MTVAGLKITVFCLSGTHPALRQVKHTKFHQKYYPRLRRNIAVGVLTDQILTTFMNVPGMEPTYATGKEARAYMLYLETGYFKVE